MGHKKQEYLKCFATVIQTDTAMFAKDPPVQKMDPTDLQLKGMGWGLGMASAALPSEAAAPTKNQIEDEMHKLGWAKPPVPPDVNVAWMAKKNYVYPSLVPHVPSMKVFTTKCFFMSTYLGWTRSTCRFTFQ